MVVGTTGPARGNDETPFPEHAPGAAGPAEAEPPHQTAAHYLDLWEAQLAATATEGGRSSTATRARRPA